MSEPLVLLLLRIPVQLINVFTTLVGTLLYAPSYLMFLMVQSIVFADWVKQTMSAYLLTWPIRLVLIVVSFALFLGQFGYSIYYGVMHVDQSSWAILGASMAISIPGIIYLMRRGYLRALKSFKVPQLKSPVEFIVELFELLADLPSIPLTLLNVLLLKNAFKTFDFDYHPKERRYLSHIARLVHQAFFFDLELMFQLYLAIFPWRRNDSEEYRNQQRGIYRLAILTALTISTLLDTLLFVLFGWLPFLSPMGSHRRYRKLLRYGKVYDYRKYILAYAALTVGEYVEMLLLLLSACLLINIKTAWRYLNQSRKLSRELNDIVPQSNSWNKALQNNSCLLNKGEAEFMEKSVQLLMLTLLQIILFVFRVIDFLSVYKQRKLRQYRKNRNEYLAIKSSASEKPKRSSTTSKRLVQEQRVEEVVISDDSDVHIDFEYQRRVFVYALEFLIDLLFLPLVPLTAVLKPWYFHHLFNVVDEEHDLKRLLIVERLVKALFFYLLLTFAIVGLPFYLHRLSWLFNCWNTIELNEEEHLFKFNWVIGQLLVQMFLDLPYLPLYYSMMASGAYFFRPKSYLKEPLDMKTLVVNYNNYFYHVVTLFYLVRARLTGRYKRFRPIYEKDQERYIKSVYDRMVFWRTVARITRRELITKLFKLLIVVTRYRRGSYERKVAKAMEEPDIYANTAYPTSEIALTLVRTKKVLSITIDMWVAIVVEIILAIIVSLVLVPLTTWRFPTLLFIYRHDKIYREVTLYQQTRHPGFRMLRLVLYVLLQQLIDLAYLPLYLVAFVACPIRFVRYCWREAYNYRSVALTNTFQEYLDKGRQYFREVVLKQSVKNAVILLEAVGVALTLVRIYYCYKLLDRAGHSFSDVVRRILGLHSDITFPEWLERRDRAAEQPQNVLISWRMCIYVSFREAIKDIPFAILVVLMLVLFPWRFNYLWNIVKDQHERVPIIMRNGRINVPGKRRYILQLFWTIIKTDFACILLNILLILSVYKIKRVVQLGYKNIRRNLFQGFLSYDYRRQLFHEVLLMLEDIGNFFRFLLILLMVIRVRNTLRRMLRLYRQRKQKKKVEAYNRKIYESTLKAGKEQQLTSIGFFAFGSICKYLEPIDLHNLEKVSKDLYVWTSDEQIWQEQWQRKYKVLSPAPNEPLSYRKLCIKSYIAQYHPKKQPELTYKQILSEEIEASLHEPITLRDFLTPAQLSYPSWTPENGFIAGQDIYDETLIFFRWVYILPIEAITSFVVRCFSNNNHRIYKQMALFMVIVTMVLAYLVALYKMWDVIFCIDKFISIKILLAVLFFSFHVVLMIRIGHLRAHVVPALFPYDFVRILATTATRYTRKCWNTLTSYVKSVLNFVWSLFKVIGRAGQKLAELILLPIYKLVVRILRILGDFIVLLAEKFVAAVTLLLDGLTAIFRIVRNLILQLGKGYLQLLANMMNFFLQYGRLGDILFTPIALAYLTLPLILSYIYYWKPVAILPASVLSIVLSLRGYYFLQARQRAR